MRPETISVLASKPGGRGRGSVRVVVFSNEFLK